MERERIFKSARKILETNGVSGKDYLDSPVKRRLDVLAAGGGSGLSLPIALAAMAVVTAEDGHHPLVRLKLPDVYGPDRHILKIRSMTPGADQKESELANGGPTYGIKKDNGTDSRITRVGAVLRQTSVDEIPQLWQVLDGQFSMVGPRWVSVLDVKYLEQQDSELAREFLAMLRSGVKPGVTGFYGIFGRGELPLNWKMELELMYVRRASLKADLKIIGRTIPAVFRRRGAR